jgi:hypothetical protein
MNQVVQPSAFETKMVRLREELNALTECVITEHTRARDEADLDEEIENVIQWRNGIVSGEIVNNKYL